MATICLVALGVFIVATVLILDEGRKVGRNERSERYGWLLIGLWIVAFWVVVITGIWMVVRGLNGD